MTQQSDTRAPAGSPAASPQGALGAALKFGGAAVGAQLYATFVLTNTIADASARGLYDAETCQMLLAEQRALLRAVRNAGRGLASQHHIATAERQFLAESELAIDRLLELADRVETMAFEPANGTARAEFGRLRVDALERVRRLLAGGAG